MALRRLPASSGMNRWIKYLAVNPACINWVHTESTYSQKVPELRMLTKKNCSLCDVAVEELWSMPGMKDRLKLVHVNILQEGNEDM